MSTSRNLCSPVQVTVLLDHPVPTWCLEEIYHGNHFTGTVQEVFETSLQRVRQAKLIIFAKFNKELTVQTEHT